VYVRCTDCLEFKKKLNMLEMLNINNFLNSTEKYAHYMYKLSGFE